MKLTFIKKTLPLLIVVLGISLLAGCGSSAAGDASDDSASESEAAEAIDLTSFKTLGDVFAFEGKDEYSEQRATFDGKYIYAFTSGGTAYRFIADLPSDIEEQLFALEFDDDYDKNEMALVSDLEIKSAEDLTDQILSQDDLDALAGKTGQELADEGWRGGSFYNSENGEAWVEYGPFAYVMHFEGEIDADNFDDFEDLAELTVKDAAYEGLGDASYIE